MVSVTDDSHIKMMLKSILVVLMVSWHECIYIISIDLGNFKYFGDGDGEFAQGFI